LEFVGGNLILRDTNIVNLELISKIGRDLHLPKKYKSLIDLSHIEIRGKVKYWNDSKYIKEGPIIKRDLIRSEIDIPHWEFQYIINYNQIKSCSNEIQSFYKYFKDSFFEKKYIDVKGESNYLFTFLLELRDTYTKNEDYPLLKNYFQTLSDCYPVLRHYTTRWIIDLVEENNENNYLKELLLNEFNDYYIGIPEYFYLLQKNNETKIDSEFIFNSITSSSLTQYGKDNIDEIKTHFNKRVLTSFDSDIVSKFYVYVKKWKRFNDILVNKQVEKNIKSILSFYERELRESENDLREIRGIPKIGEGWISETELYYHIKNEFSECKVHHHGKPKWLGRQHLDIYIEDLNIGIEYMGSQHYEPIEYFGGNESLLKTIERDKKKREICISNGCSLLIVNEGYILSEVVSFIRKTINNPSKKPLLREFP
jgi:hypothetical protein